MADSPFHNPFAGLAGIPGVPAPEPAAKAEAADPAPGTPRVARAVVRMERAGRGGKTVTVIDHLGLDAASMTEWLTALKAALGCGGVVDDGRIVLQGDHRGRAATLLTARGVKKVTVG